jgi:hypothetical protein
LYVLDCFNTLILKIIFLKNIKNIILIHFDMKNILKNNCNHTLKYTRLVRLPRLLLPLIYKKVVLKEKRIITIRRYFHDKIYILWLWGNICSCFHNLINYTFFCWLLKLRISGLLQFALEQLSVRHNYWNLSNPWMNKKLILKNLWFFYLIIDL